MSVHGTLDAFSDDMLYKLMFYLLTYFRRQFSHIRFIVMVEIAQRKKNQRNRRLMSFLYL